jgi:hypothetical protein
MLFISFNAMRDDSMLTCDEQSRIEEESVMTCSIVLALYSHGVTDKDENKNIWIPLTPAVTRTRYP